MSLARRVVLLNSVVLLVAWLALALGPATVSAPVHARELVVLLAGLVVTLGANLVLVRRAFAPLERLTRLMRTVDPLAARPAPAHRGGAATRACAELAEAFNAMLERLEDERRDSAPPRARARRRPSAAARPRAP